MSFRPKRGIAERTIYINLELHEAKGAVTLPVALVLDLRCGCSDALGHLFVNRVRYAARVSPASDS